MTRQKSRKYCLIAWAWALVCLLLLVLVFFFPHMRYGAKTVFASPFILAPFGLVFLGLLYLIMKDITIYKGMPLLIGLLFLAFQIWCVKNYYFVTGWDSSNLIYAGVLAPYGQTDAYLVDYFSYYPNNIFLAILYCRIFSHVHALGKSWTDALEIILNIQCLISFATGLVTFKLIEALTKQRPVAFWGYLVYLLLIGLSPWVSIAYSDSATLLFPVLLLFLYFLKPEHFLLKSLKWFAIGALSMLGYRLKPTTAIPVIAMVCMESYRFSKTRSWKSLAKRILLIFLGALCSGLLISKMTDAFYYETDPEKKIGIVHFFAMGLNENRMGVWSGDDVAYSKSFLTVSERNAADWQLAKERLKAMGFRGLLRQWMRKLLTCFHDGTFAWTHEGNFFAQIFNNDSKIAKITRSFYYSSGENYHVFQNTEQAIWLCVLLFSLGAFFSRSRLTATVELTLLGLILYLILFEVRARYVYIFAPLFIVLAACGIDKIFSIAMRRLKRAAPLDLSASISD